MDKLDSCPGAVTTRDFHIFHENTVRKYVHENRGKQTVFFFSIKLSLNCSSFCITGQVPHLCSRVEGLNAAQGVPHAYIWPCI